MLLQQQGLVAVHRRQGQHRQGTASLALASLEGTGKDAVLVTNLPDKGLATGRPLELDFWRMFL
jgi:hypothetical protein